MKTLEPFFVNDKKVNFYSLTGVVASSTKTSTTRVTGHGGGSRRDIFGNHYVADVKFDSNTIETHEIWIKTEDTKEHLISLNNHNVSVRDGQIVTLICLSGENEDVVFYVKFINHTADLIWTLMDSDVIIDKNYDKDRHAKESIIWLLFLCIASIGTYFLFSNKIIKYNFLRLLYIAAPIVFITLKLMPDDGSNARREEVKDLVQNIERHIIKLTRDAIHMLQVTCGGVSEPPVALSIDPKTETVFCTECGVHQTANVKFCSSCGYRMDVAQMI
jgi:hypothetical protein